MKKVICISVLWISALTTTTVWGGEIEKNEDGKKYGGSASVTVEVKPVSLGCDANSKLFDKVKDGDRRVITVSVSCDNDSESGAKEALKMAIGYDKKCYEKEVTSVDFDIDDCE